MENKIFKEIINYINYTPVISRIDTIDTPAIIEKVNLETRKYMDHMKINHKFKAFRNYSINFGCTEGNEPGYPWNDYITREYLPKVLYKYFTHLIQLTRSNRGQVRRRSYPRKNDRVKNVVPSWKIVNLVNARARTVTRLTDRSSQ